MVKVVVIRKNKNLVFATLKVMPLDFENLNNSQKLAIMGLVLSLYRNHFSKKEGY